jgi:hypothetical protein
MDWNRNGKRDPADDIIDRKLSEAGKEPEEPPSARPRAAHIRSDIWLPLIYLGLLLPGDIPINSFTMVIGLICATALAWKFLKWLCR